MKITSSFQHRQNDAKARIQASGKGTCRNQLKEIQALYKILNELLINTKKVATRKINGQKNRKNEMLTRLYVHAHIPQYPTAHEPTHYAHTDGQTPTYNNAYTINCYGNDDLIQPNIAEMLADNDVCDCIEHESNVPCICGTCEVRVNLLFGLLTIQCFEFQSNVLLGIFIRVGTCE